MTNNEFTAPKYKLTAETITDEQIDKLSASLESALKGAEQIGGEFFADGETARLAEMIATCVTARHEYDYPTARFEARARCADILNAREASK